MKNQKAQLWLVIFLLFSKFSFSQCTSCTYSAPLNGSSFDGGSGAVKLCITGDVSNLVLTNFGSDDIICLTNGITWTQSTNLSFNGVTLNINQGILNMNAAFTFNNTATINISNGGKLNSNQASFTGNNGNLTINNGGTITLTNSGTVSIMSLRLNNLSTGILTATSPSYVSLAQCWFNNAGSMIFSNLENNDGQSFINSGKLVVQRYFYNHGNLSNTGCISTTCGTTTNGNSSPCELYVGNKGSGVLFNNATNGCITLTGDAVFDGPFTNNGTLTVSPVSGGTGNFTANQIITNTGGKIIVENGTSGITLAGSIIGGNFMNKANLLGFQGDPTLPKVKYGFNSNNANPPYSTVSINGSITSTCNCSTSQLVLPMKITNFNCTKLNDKNVLNLLLGESVNGSKLYLETSSNGIDFENNGLLQHQTDFSYNFTDQARYATPIYYRVKEIDQTGLISYSNSIIVNPNIASERYSIFPNPVKDMITIKKTGNYNSNENIVIYNINGEKIYSNFLQSNSLLNIKLNNLPGGQYMMVVFKEGTRVFSKTFVKTN